MKHGAAKRNKETPEYRAWKHMKSRCYNPNVEKYSDYGGRGILVCDRWLQSFSNFYEDMGPRPSPYHSIDRMDNNSNYESSNCRWATKSEQAYNRRQGKRPRKLAYRGVSIVDLAKSSGLNVSTLRHRLKNGHPVDFDGDLRSLRPRNKRGLFVPR